MPFSDYKGMCAREVIQNMPRRLPTCSTSNLKKKGREKKNMVTIKVNGTGIAFSHFAPKNVCHSLMSQSAILASGDMT